MIFSVHVFITLQNMFFFFSRIWRDLPRYRRNHSTTFWQSNEFHFQSLSRTGRQFSEWTFSFIAKCNLYFPLAKRVKTYNRAQWAYRSTILPCELSSIYPLFCMWRIEHSFDYITASCHLYTKETLIGRRIMAYTYTYDSTKEFIH